MSIDTQVQALVDGMSAGGMPEFSELGHQALREMCESMLLPFEMNWPVTAVDRQIAVHGSEIPVHIYTPPGSGPFPLLVYFHGGGWTIGSPNTHDPICRALSMWGKVIVVSVHYRRAPEFPFPVPLEDCYAATLWCQDNAMALHADGKPLMVAGDSAGGNLAAAVCLLARDRHRAGQEAPQIRYQLLFYPVTDCDFDTTSYRTNGEQYLLRRSDMQWFWQQYIANPLERLNPYASPLRANLQQLPPATVITAQYDPLRDEGNAYAKKLQQAGVAVIHREVPGMIHGFIGFAALLDKGREELQRCAEELPRPGG